MPHIFLYGAPGAGKTTLGKALAAHLHLPFIDLDEEIVRAAGQSIPQLMQEQGEGAFRALEAESLARTASQPDSVIALGGGALLREENRRLAESAGDVLFLQAEEATLLQRLAAQQNARPLLAGDLQTKLRALLQTRRAHYDSFSLRVAAESVTPAAACIALGRFHVRGMGTPYDILVRSGGIHSLGSLLRARGLTGSAVLVTDENIAPHYAQAVLQSLGAAQISASLLVLPPGEENKTLQSISRLWSGFLQAGLDRKGTVIALGGGVIGDMAGFAAATFMRGCAWVALPTTLLSMVDASIGGKTGFDLPEGKNLVGAFAPPRLVLADPQTLLTLPPEELRSGMAEVVKHALIADPLLLDLCRPDYPQRLEEIVRRAIAVKVQVIEQDPYEQGIRAALNLGHTVGHAVEIVSGFRLRHGEAVAIGTVAEARLAERLGMTEPGSRLGQQIAEIFSGLGLPIEIPPHLEREAILRAMRVDKKKQNQVVRFALPLKIGEVRVGVALQDLSEALP